VWWGLREPDISDFERLTSQTRAVLMCHDVIPLLFPEYYQDPDVTPRFKRALPIFSNASAVVCNSHGTQQDLSQALIAAGLPVPQTRALQLPPGLSPSGPPSVISLNPKPERFVLAVGSISRRKNQAMLLDAWSRLAGDASLEDVKLIIVGGWDDNSASVRDRLRRDPELAGRVILMNNVTDGELASLYRNCLFTVYPSLYEGWGLPIGESLSFGKLCVASSGRAMEEAGGSLCLHLNPIDIDQWERTIRTLLADPAQRAEREIKIKASYKATDWKSVSDTIFDIARSSPPRPEG
jgi:glycosyltransferase involved in cell wall biosynthesis